MTRQRKILDSGLNRSSSPQSRRAIVESASGATFGSVERRQVYRYDLWRFWAEPFEIVNFIMLNPSTATATQTDPTIRQCIGFAKRWGFGGLIVTNLYGYRATDPLELWRAADPIGPRNDEFLMHWAGSANLVVAAWGNQGAVNNRGGAVLKQLRNAGIKLHRLKLTRAGEPVHPLYQPGESAPTSLDERRLT
jgi:hypothetical protein